MLHQNASVINISMCNNGIGNEEATVLSTAFPHNTFLICLNLGDKGIGNVGAKALIEALRQNTSFVNLDPHLSQLEQQDH